MREGYQAYEVNVKFIFEAEVFPDDPEDIYELAALEEKSVATELSISFPSAEITELSVVPAYVGD